MKQHKLSCIDEVFSIGATRLGLKTSACPLALITEPMTGRQPCINRGFCEQGCKSKAKSTTLHNYIPRGIESGAKIIDNAFVYKINTSKDERTVTSIEYYKEGKKHELECEILIISAFTIETPRLLLMNKSDRHPNGLANSSNMVGKNLMCHTDHEIFAKFERPLRLYRNPPITSINQDFYETNNERDFKRGFSIAPYSARPISFAKTAISCRKDLWGDRLIDFMKNYNFYMQLGMIGEVLPYETNKVELSNEKDKFGLPIPKATFNLEQNEKKMIKFALEKMEEIAKSAGAIKTFRAPLLVHLLGTTRMGEDPATSVIDRDLKAHDLDNLYISGGSVFPTGGAVNPTLTIQALSARLADNFIAKYK